MGHSTGQPSLLARYGEIVERGQAARLRRYDCLRSRRPLFRTHEVGDEEPLVTASDAPWQEGLLRIHRSALAAVEADAIARYGSDEEACGYLSGPAGDVVCDETVPLPNLANKLHKLDPATYFRLATFLRFNDKKFDDAVSAGKAAGRPVKVLYHSHLDAGAYFSKTDEAVLSFGEPPASEGGDAKLGPGPQWPLAFLVTSVRKGAGGAAAAVDDHKVFVWSGSAFVESTFAVVD